MIHYSSTITNQSKTTCTVLHSNCIGQSVPQTEAMQWDAHTYRPTVLLQAKKTTTTTTHISILRGEILHNTVVGPRVLMLACLLIYVHVYCMCSQGTSLASWTLSFPSLRQYCGRVREVTRLIGSLTPQEVGITRPKTRK